jgi:hypothetical protein
MRSYRTTRKLKTAAEESSIGRLMATIRERIGNHAPLEGGPGEPVYANAPPVQPQAPMPVPIQQYQQNGHQQPQGQFSPGRRTNAADANRTEMLPARPVAPVPADPYNVDLPVEFGDEGTRRNDVGRNGANGQRPENGWNGYAPNGNGHAPVPRDGTSDEAVAQRGRPSP